MTATFAVDTEAPRESIDITGRVRAIVAEATIGSGLCHVMVLHTTAAVLLNESDDPNLGRDILDALARAVPEQAGWRHDRIDDNAHAHIQAAIVGSSATIPVADGELVLGTWQRVLLLEFDGPRRLRVHVQLLAATG
jgi:secondary thiamine-phosphate synthase enzyme